MIKKACRMSSKHWLGLFVIFCITIPDLTFGQIGVGTTVSSIKSEPANAQGIGKSGIGFILSAGAPVYKVLAFSLDAGVEFFDDKKQFTQQTTGGEMSSSVSMLYGSIAAGLVTPRIRFSKNPKGLGLVLGMYYGTEWIGGDRSIEKCVDCRSENVDLKGGVYREPALQIYISGSTGVGLSYRYYNDRSDLKNRLILKIVFLLGSKRNSEVK